MISLCSSNLKYKKKFREIAINPNVNTFVEQEKEIKVMKNQNLKLKKRLLCH